MSLFLTSDQLASALDCRGACRAIERAWASFARGDAAILARQRIDCGPVKLSTMGAIWRTAGTAGAKTYTTVDGRFEFVFDLFDISESGQGRHVASMDGSELTRLRTPALSAHVSGRGTVACRKLALFGFGVQGRAHLEALAALLPLREVCVVETRDAGGDCEAAARRLDLPVRQCTAEAAVRDADLVVTATRSKQPLFDGGWLKPGAFVVAVGTSLPTGRELDDTTLMRAARVIVEWKPQSLVEAGEVVIGRQLGLLDEARIVDVPQIMAGQAVWRESAEEIVVFKSVGVGLMDLAVATEAWKSWRGRAA
jgi:ornithine cyclodeaminase